MSFHARCEKCNKRIEHGEFYKDIQYNGCICYLCDCELQKVIVEWLSKKSEHWKDTKEVD